MENYGNAGCLGSLNSILINVLEDVGTGGWGALNDWQTFQLALKIVRFAWKL